MLVRGTERVAIARHGVVGNLSRLTGAESARVHEGEVRHVEEVVGQQTGTGSCFDHGQITTLERRVTRRGDCREKRQWFVRRDEDHAVRFSDVGGGCQPRARRNGRVRSERRYLNADAFRVIGPAVIAAAQYVAFTRTERERRKTMRTTVEEDAHVTGR